MSSQSEKRDYTGERIASLEEKVERLQEKLDLRDETIGRLARKIDDLTQQLLDERKAQIAMAKRLDAARSGVFVNKFHQ